MRRTVWKELVDESMLKIRGHQLSAKRCLQNLLKTLTARITPRKVMAMIATQRLAIAFAL